MAGESVVGALRVVLGMDTAAFEDGTKRAVSKVEGFAAAFQRAFAAATVAAVFTALIKGISDTIDQMDQLGKMAQKIGIPVEELSALKYAANLADVSTESLSLGMVRLAKNMSAVAGGAGGPAKEAFKALNITLTDSSGNLKSTSDLMGELSDKFAGFKDSAAKTALAVALFGRGGADLIPLLNEGRKGLASAAEEARKFGLIVTDEAAKGAQDFNDNLKRLSSVMGGVMIQVTSGLAGELVHMSDAMVAVAKNGTTVAIISDSITVAIRAVLLEVVAVTTYLGNMVTAVMFLGQAGAAIVTGNFSKIPQLFQDAKDKTADINASFLETTKSLLGLGPAAGVAGDAFAGLLKSVDALEKKKTDAPILATKDALDHFIDSTKKSIAAQQAQLDTFYSGAGALEKAKFLLEAYQVAASNDIKISAQRKAAIDALGASLQLMNQKLAGQQLTLEMSPWLQYQKDLTNVISLLQSGSISLDTFTLKSQLLAINLSIAYATAYDNIAKNAASAFKDLASLNHDYAGIAKAAAIAQATIATYLGAANAYAQAALIGGPVLGAIAAAVAVAAGLANVAKIVATPFATGGSFKVGGAGGIDSQLVTLAATPGEMVDVRRPGQAGYGGSEITVQGMAPDDLFTGSMLRNLFDAINQGHRDGYRLKFAE